MIHMTPPDVRVFQALLRNDLRPFINKAFTTLCPGQTYEMSWHIEAIAHRLEQIRCGKIRRLIINMPPRSLKSIATSVAFPAYALGLDPTRRFICVSYSAELAKKHSNDFRAVIEALWYRALFPDTRIGQKDSETEIELTARGFRLATSVGGTLTGRGGDIIVIDDPLKPDDAYSEAKRTAANEWFKNTLLSRLDDKRTGAIVLVMQRVHMDDLTGFVTGESDEWKVLNLPAIAEADEAVPISDTKVYHRRAGEALSVREPLSVLENLKRQLGSDAFSAQYQQMPIPPGGAMIKCRWIERYDELPPREEWLTVLQSWDTASKGGPENDFSVCTTWVVTRGIQRWYLIDVWRKRVDYPELRAAVITLAAKHKAKRVLVEDAGAGIALVQELRRGKVSGIVAVKPERDKISRMAVVSAKFEAGEVCLPRGAPWLADFERELFAFPGSKYDDQCDSVSQALSRQNYQLPMQISDAALAAADRPDQWYRNLR